MPVTLALRRLSQEDSCEVKDGLIYVVSSIPAWATQGGPCLKIICVSMLRAENVVLIEIPRINSH